MNPDVVGEFAAAVERALKDVDGVDAVFRPGGVVVSAVDAGARALGLHNGSLVRVTVQGAAGVHIEAEIGVSAEAADTVRRAQAAVAALAHAASFDPVHITLTVAHVSPLSG